MPMENIDKTQLEQLAQQLHRPVMSLKDLDQLSEQDLAWLNEQLQQTVQRANRRMNQSLYQTPFFLRWFFKHKP